MYRLLHRFLFLPFLFVILYSCTHMSADTQLRQGDYGKAAQAVSSYGISSENQTSDYVVRVCYTYSRLKIYDKLFECLDKLEENIEKGDKSIGSSFFNNSMNFPSDISLLPALMRAEAYIDTGNYSKAQEYAKYAYDHISDLPAGDKMNNWDRRHKMDALSLLVMANAFSGKNEEAQKYLRELEDQGIGFAFGYFTARYKKHALSKAYMAAGQYENILKTAASFSLTTFFADIVTLGIMNITAVKNNTFGYTELPQKFMVYKAYFETGQYDEARKGYESLLQNPATISNGQINWAMLFDRGRIAEKQNDLKAAVGFYKKAIDIIESQRSTINTEASKIGFVGDKQTVYAAIIFAMMKNGNSHGALEYAERSKSRTLVDLLASADRIMPPSDTSAEYLAQLEETETQFASNDINVDKLALATRSIKLRKDFMQAAPETASLVTADTITADEIFAILKDGQNILEYYYYKESGIVFIIDKTSVKAFSFSTKDLYTDISEFRKALSSPLSDNYRHYSEKLYSTLIRPVQSHISEKTLIVIPHGIIHYIPFAYLCSGSECLIDKASISLLPSASTSKYIKDDVNNGKMLIIGNPYLGDDRYSLAFADKEADAIEEMFPNSVKYKGKDATEDIFRKQAARYSYIHFATHGTFESSSPLNSGLYLAGNEHEDGLLTVNELYGLRLNAELVMLSACETGLSRINAGDDLIGLQRGFLYAGANSVLATLWKVDDAATKDIAVAFYKNIRTMIKPEALRQAQMEIRKKYPHPYYWASFQYTGMPR